MSLCRTRFSHARRDSHSRHLYARHSGQPYVSIWGNDNEFTRTSSSNTRLARTREIVLVKCDWVKRGLCDGNLRTGGQSVSRWTKKVVDTTTNFQNTVGKKFRRLVVKSKASAEEPGRSVFPNFSGEFKNFRVLAGNTHTAGQYLLHHTG